VPFRARQGCRFATPTFRSEKPNNRIIVRRFCVVPLCEETPGIAKSIAALYFRSASPTASRTCPPRTDTAGTGRAGYCAKAEIRLRLPAVARRPPDGSRSCRLLCLRRQRSHQPRRSPAVRRRTGTLDVEVLEHLRHQLAAAQHAGLVARDAHDPKYAIGTRCTAARQSGQRTRSSGYRAVRCQL
jgi:hypothetical protein